MATHYFYGYAPDAFTSPEPGTMQLDPGWDVQDDAYDFHITDDDDNFQGDSNSNEVSDDSSQQTGVVYDENGNVVASGNTYLEEAYVLTDGYGNTVRLYRVEIGGTHVGYIADGPIQPGNTYTFSSTENVNDSNAPQYSNLEDQSYNEDTANDIDGTTNDDTLTSDSGSDTINAGSGDDSISSGGGGDVVYGEAGNDTIDSAQQDGSVANDGDFVDGGTGDDSITGSGGDDTIHGGADNDTIFGGGGNDTIDGGTGDDSISGGGGNDTITGGDGNDTIEGGFGDDSIDGGDGNDLLIGGDEGATTVNGSIGTDNYSETGDGYSVTAQNVSGGALTSANVANVSTSGGGLGASGSVSDTDSGQDNQLAFDKASGISERLIVDFDNDVTSASFSFQSLFTDSFGEVAHWAIYDDGVLVSEADFTEDPVGSGSGTVDLSGFGTFDQIIFTALLQTDGTDGSDYVITDISYTMPLTETSNDTITGGAGDDTIFGGSGQDSLSGGADNDSIEGGGGTDVIFGGDGDDTIDGGDRTDTVYGGAGDDLISDSGGAASDDTIYGEAGNDTISGGTREDYLDGGDDADTFIVEDGFGDDTIVGGEGGTDDDTVDLSNLSGPVTLTYSGEESGTFSDGTSTASFSEIENITPNGQVNVDGTTDIEFGGNDAVATEDNTPPSGIQHQYKLDGDATDSIGGNDGTVNGATTVAGRDGDALSFDETNDYVTIPDVTMNNEFTVSFQFKIDDTTGNLFQYIYSHGDINNTNSLNVFLTEASHGTDPNVLRTVIRDADDTLDNAALEFDISGIVGDGQWHTYTLTVENGVGSKVFLDGVQQNSDTRGGDGFNPSGDLYLGARQDLNADRYYGGELDTVQIYDRPLNSSEVSSLHTATGPTILEGTVVADVTNVVDADGDTGHTFALSDDAGGKFVIDSNSGEISLAGDHDASSVYSDTVTVEVTDLDGLTYSETLGIVLGTDDGNDTVTGPHTQNVMYGLGGNDSLTGGSKADAIYGGEGQDTLVGGAGNDTIHGSADNDSIEGGLGDDTLTGGSGDDSILGGDGNDTLDGGSVVAVAPTSESLNWDAEGADETDLTGGFTQDTGVMDVSVSYTNDGAGSELSVETSDKQYVAGGEPFNEFSAAEIGGAGTGPYSTTTINFVANTSGYSSEVENVQFRLNDIDSDNWTDHVTINAYDANGNLVPVTIAQSGNGDDIVSGNEITGANGTDNSANESGSATVDIAGPVQRIEIIYENTGTNSALIYVTDVHFETLPATDDDVLTGGAGDDVFTIGDGHDTITDFNTGNTGTLQDGDSSNNDFIDLSGYYDNLSELYADQADDGVLNQSNATDSKGRSVDYADNTQFGGGSMRVQGASADNSSFTQENTGVVCFTSGTAIRTPQGDRLIDELRAGDLVCTLDNGPQRIRWIGRRRLGRDDLRANPHLCPVLIRRGVMGAERDLLVSPQHGMLMPDQTLIRAKFLAEAKGTPVRIARGQRGVTYIHLLFDQHQIIFAENTRSESLYPGKMAFAAMDPAARVELVALFPELDAGLPEAPETWYGSSARAYLKRQVALRSAGRALL